MIQQLAIETKKRLPEKINDHFGDQALLFFGSNDLPAFSTTNFGRVHDHILGIQHGSFLLW